MRRQTRRLPTSPPPRFNLPTLHTWRHLCLQQRLQVRQVVVTIHQQPRADAPSQTRTVHDAGMVELVRKQHHLLLLLRLLLLRPLLLRLPRPLLLLLRHAAGAAAACCVADGGSDRQVGREP